MAETGSFGDEEFESDACYPKTCRFAAISRYFCERLGGCWAGGATVVGAPAGPKEMSA